MHEQTAQREERLLESAAGASEVVAVVAVAAGAGNRSLFESLGATVVDGGSTMNPATADLLAAIESAAAADVVVLPNNRNVFMAAEQAAEHAGKTVRVVPTESLQGGLAALVAFDSGAGAVENAETMARAAEVVATGAVTISSRDVELNGVPVRSGTWLGLAEGEPIAGGETFEEVARAVLDRLLATPRDVLTLLTGDEPPSLDALLAELAAEHPELELEVHAGGQPHYPLLLAAE
jgi:dihydroxyacetone kinase-like predicted kinase